MRHLRTDDCARRLSCKIAGATLGALMRLIPREVVAELGAMWKHRLALPLGSMHVWYDMIGFVSCSVQKLWQQHGTFVRPL